MPVDVALRFLKALLMPNAWNILQLVHYITSVIITNVCDLRGPTCKLKLNFLYFVVKPPGLLELLQTRRIRNAYDRSYWKFLLIGSHGSSQEGLE